MAWLMAKIYDRFMAETEAACLNAWRSELLSGLSGTVLEVGAGTGINLPLYPETIERLVVSEPDPHMRGQLEQKGLLRAHMKLSASPLGALDAEPETFDAVVSTLVLCSVPDPDSALADIRRVLKPGGRLVFLEHVAAPDNPDRLKWQRRIEPIWKHVAGGCHVTRDTASSIEAAGFILDEITRESLRKALPWIRPSIRGCAVKPA